MFPILIATLTLSLSPVTVSGVISRETNAKGVFLGYIVHQRTNSFGDTRDYHIATTTDEQEARLEASVGKEVRVTGTAGSRSFRTVLVAESVEAPHPSPASIVKTLTGYVVVGDKDGSYCIEALNLPYLGMTNYLIDTVDPEKIEKLRSLTPRKFQVKIVGRVSDYPPTHSYKVEPETIEKIERQINPEIASPKK